MIKKLKPDGMVDIEFCDNKKIESRKNSVTKPAFEEDISDNDGNSQPGEADDEIDDMMSDLDCVRTTN